MGVEIVFVLVYPEALVCLAAAVWFWSTAVMAQQTTLSECIRGFVPLIVGLTVSIAGLTLLTYIERTANFTWLVQNGYYNESQRSTYLPQRVLGELFVELVFKLPVICLLVVPWTTKQIGTGSLKWSLIGSRTMIGSILISLAGWLWNLSVIIPPYSIPDLLSSTLIPILVCALPIPIAALLLFPRSPKRL